MPSVRDFDKAFRPTDSQIDRLTALLRMVESLNIRLGTAELTVDGKTYTVTPNLCHACGAAADEDCPHKAITRKAVEYARELDELDYQEHVEAQAGARAVAVGMG